MTYYVVRGGGPDNYPGGAAWLASSFRSRSVPDRSEANIGFRTFRPRCESSHMSNFSIVVIEGNGWRNRRRPVRCPSDHQPTDSPNNDLGFRTFRNAREVVIHGRKGIHEQ